MAAVQVYIGIGSNLDRPFDQVNNAFIALESLAIDRQVETSPLYRTRPVGPQDQPDFINSVAGFKTSLTALDLLDSLLRIESAQGRQRSEDQWGPRTLDLDLLVYGEETIDGEQLQVPHPRIAERAFVLVPLMDIAPDLYIPDQGKVKDLAAQHDEELVKVHVDS